MAPPRWNELDRTRKRRTVIHTTLSIAVTWAVLLGIYYLIPFTHLTDLEAFVRLTIGIVAFVIVLVWQLRRVVGANLPGVRAVEALGSSIPLFLVVFAATYLSLAHSAPRDFSEPLNHTSALYFSVTIFSTVGFGDITPRGDVARIVVSTQMLLDLVVIGSVVRLLTTAAKKGLSEPEPRADPAGAPDNSEG